MKTGTKATNVQVVDRDRNLINFQTTPSGTLIGQASGGDFTTAYLAATTITLGTAPYTHTYISTDIVEVHQFNTDGELVEVFTHSSNLMTVVTSVLTVTGATFVTTDTFIVYTNINKIEVTSGSISVVVASIVGDGRQVVATPGTAVALAATTAIKEVTITAELGNTDLVCVGSSTVVAALATQRGTPLYPGDSVTLKSDDLAEVFIDAIDATDGVVYTYLG